MNINFKTCNANEDILEVLLERAKDKTRAVRYSERTKRASCVYLAPNGRRCFVGVFIPDEPAYKPLLDCGSIGDLFDTTSRLGLTEFHNWLGTHYELLAKAQGIHDGTHVDEWGQALRNLSNS